MKNNNELISIIVPVYNVEKYLKRCISSIIEQTYKNIEIILVDDGSTDKSLEICKKYSKTDKRINVYHKKNGGLSSARNYGIKKSKGNYIIFVDSDDYINNFFVEKLYMCLINEQADISCCYFETFSSKDPTYNIENKKNIKIDVFDSKQAIINMMYDKGINNSASCKIYKKELFKKISYPLNMYFEDLATTYKVFDISKKIVLYRCPLYYYYQRSESILHQINDKKINDLLHTMTDINLYFKNKPEYKNSILAREINAHFYIYRNSNNKALKSSSKEFIKKNRKTVLFDSNITKKTKYGLLLSYISFSLVNHIFYAKEIIKNKRK